MEDKSDFEVIGHVTVRSFSDYGSGAGELVHLDKKNAVHKENMAVAVAKAMGGQSTGHVYKMAFGTGGATVDALEAIVYASPNVTGVADLNIPAYEETVDQNRGGPVGNQMTVRHTGGTLYADLEIRCVIDKTEPAGQSTFDNITAAMAGNFVFDEIGLKTDEGLLLSHITFNPIQKSANRVIEVVYLLRFRMV